MSARGRDGIPADNRGPLVVVGIENDAGDVRLLVRSPHLNMTNGVLFYDDVGTLGANPVIRGEVKDGVVVDDSGHDAFFDVDPLTVCGRSWAFGPPPETAASDRIAADSKQACHHFPFFLAFDVSDIDAFIS